MADGRGIDTTVRLLALIALATLVVNAGPRAADSEATLDSVEGPETHTFTNVSPSQLATIDWALALFEEAGLGLPGIDFAQFPDRSHCAGRIGAAIAADERVGIRLCTDRSGPVLEWLLLHEIAHAWDRQSLDESRRRAFIDLRGLSSWREGDWHDRGAEHAAEIVVWGLIDRPVRPGHIDNTTCVALLAGYRTLTGADPLHGFTEVCAE